MSLILGATLKNSISQSLPIGFLKTTIAISEWISGFLLAAPKKRTTRAKKVFYISQASKNDQ